MGKRSLKELSKKDLVSYDELTAKMIGIPFSFEAWEDKQKGDNCPYCGSCMITCSFLLFKLYGTSFLSYERINALKRNTIDIYVMVGT